MNNRALFRTGIVGSVIAAICCFTPFLGVLFAALGISALMGAWLDFVLLPALALFLIITGYAAYRMRRASR
ncbi:MAG: mercury resistance system transport protein MerF [Alphaproteobacteria bacterium]|nr:mercury resistance system transport protein MerF [Alphaproteobacteria bacterium]